MTKTSGAARWAARLGAAAAVAYVVGPLAAHFSILPARVGFLLFALGGLIALVASGFAFVALLRGAGASALASAIPGLVVAFWFLITAAGARRYPPINDITTDSSNPPKFQRAASLPENQGRDMSHPGLDFAEQQRSSYPDLGGLRLALPPAEAYQRVLHAARANPSWQIIREDPEAGAVEGVDTTWLFRFQDDFVIEVRPRNGGSVVEMRSKSRDGRGDIGANAKRIRAFFQSLQ
jgi:uncharacterized protein (DUF1499 family)